MLMVSWLGLLLLLMLMLMVSWLGLMMLVTVVVVLWLVLWSAVVVVHAVVSIVRQLGHGDITAPGHSVLHLVAWRGGRLGLGRGQAAVVGVVDLLGRAVVGGGVLLGLQHPGPDGTVLVVHVAPLLLLRGVPEAEDLVGAGTLVLATLLGSSRG